MPELKVIHSRQQLGITRGEVRHFTAKRAQHLLDLGLAEPVTVKPTRKGSTAKKKGAPDAQS